MIDPRDLALERMLEETLGGDAPPDLTTGIVGKVARRSAGAGGQRTRWAMAVLALAGVAAAAFAVGSWLPDSAAVAVPGAVRVVVANGSLEWTSQGESVRAAAGETREVRPRVGDRLRSAPTQTTEFRLDGLGTLRCWPATELEVRDMRWKEVGLGSLTLAVLVGGALWLGDGEPLHVPAGREVTAERGTAERGTAEKVTVETRATARLDADDGAPGGGGRSGEGGARTAVPATGLAHVHGVCVTADGRPVQGCRIELHATARSDVPSSDATRGWRPPDALRTPADGSFSLRFSPPPEFAFELRFRGGDAAPMECAIQHLDPGEDLDLGQVVLQPGTRVQAIVVDAQRQPVPDLVVRFEAASPAPREDRRPHPTAALLARADAHGRFTTPALVPGVYRLRLEDEKEGVLVSPREFDVHPDAGVQTVQIVVRQ